LRSCRGIRGKRRERAQRMNLHTQTVVHL
jgi:hypothetical protein